MSHTVDVGLQLLVGIHGHVAHEVVVALCRSEKMVSAVLGVGGSAQEVLQHIMLQSLRLVEVLFQLMLSGCEYVSCNAS